MPVDQHDIGALSVDKVTKHPHSRSDRPVKAHPTASIGAPGVFQQGRNLNDTQSRVAQPSRSHRYPGHDRDLRTWAGIKQRCCDQAVPSNMTETETIVGREYVTSHQAIVYLARD
jgi:hypothetical protein